MAGPFDSFTASLQWLGDRMGLHGAGEGEEGVFGQPTPQGAGSDQGGSPGTPSVDGGGLDNIKSAAGMMQRAKKYFPLYEAASKKYGVPLNILLGQGQQESGFDPSAKGGAGDAGLAQFIPSTAKQWGVNVNDPASSVDGQGRFMAALYKKTGNWGKALAMYNSGHTNDPAYVGSVAKNAARWDKILKAGGFGNVQQMGQAQGQGQPQGAAPAAAPALKPNEVGAAAGGDMQGQQVGTQPAAPAPAAPDAASADGAPGPADIANAQDSANVGVSNPDANLNRFAGSAFGPGFTLQQLVQQIKKKNPNITPATMALAIENLRPLLSQQGAMEWHLMNIDAGNQRNQLNNDTKVETAGMSQEGQNARNAASNQTRIQAAGMSIAMRQSSLDQQYKEFLGKQDLSTKRISIAESNLQEKIRKDAASLAQGDDKIKAAQLKEELEQWSKLNEMLNSTLRGKIAASGSLGSDSDQLEQQEQERYESVQKQIQALQQNFGLDDNGIPSSGTPSANPDPNDPLGLN